VGPAAVVTNDVKNTRKYVRPLNVCIADFNSAVNELISLMLKKTRIELDKCNLELLQKRIAMLKQQTGISTLIHLANPFFIDRADDIIDPTLCEKLILESDVRKEYLATGQKIETSDEFVFELVGSVRTHYRAARAEEKTDVYLKLNRLLTCCIEYRIHAEMQQH
jgi:hypothetical protein